MRSKNSVIGVIGAIGANRHPSRERMFCQLIHSGRGLFVYGIHQVDP
jgi:hypothetical protein